MHDRRIANALAARDYFVVGLWVHDDLHQLYDHSRYGVLSAHERGALGAKPHGSPVHLAASQLPPIPLKTNLAFLDEKNRPLTSIFKGSSRVAPIANAA